MKADQNAMKFMIVQHIADISRENNGWKVVRSLRQKTEG